MDNEVICVYIVVVMEGGYVYHKALPCANVWYVCYGVLVKPGMEKVNSCMVLSKNRTTKSLSSIPMQVARVKFTVTNVGNRSENAISIDTVTCF